METSVVIRLKRRTSKMAATRRRFNIRLQRHRAVLTWTKSVPAGLFELTLPFCNNPSSAASSFVFRAEMISSWLLAAKPLRCRTAPSCRKTTSSSMSSSLGSCASFSYWVVLWADCDAVSTAPAIEQFHTQHESSASKGTVSHSKW